jgi:membrane carboxypeptidase/penicillin-binding protein
MKRLWRIVATFAALLVLTSAGVVAWLYLYTADLPSVSQIDRFDPPSESLVNISRCDGSSTTITAFPRRQLGLFLPNAVLVAEGKPDPNKPFLAVARDLLRSEGKYGHYSWQIARDLVCSGHPLQRTVQELRVANAIERTFSQEQILTIYLNTIYVGSGMYGADAASEHYFRRPPSDLSLAQAATIAALIRNPNYYSPMLHPDNALARRNAVIDRMFAIGSISADYAQEAKESKLVTR